MGLRINVTTSGSLAKTENFLRRVSQPSLFSVMDHYAQLGVSALAAATPVDTGETASQWGYEIEHSRGRHSITWTNAHTVGGTPVAIMLQYGHGTGTGGYVQGQDFINPALKPIFDKISDEVWKAVTSA
jgi:hypothetical protein